MKSFYKYFYSKLHYIYTDIFCRKDFPYLWASIIISLFISINIAVIFKIIQYNLLPREFNFYSNNHYYISFIILASVLTFNQHKDRYKSFLKCYNSMHKKVKRRLMIISIIYVLLSFFMFFHMGNLLRQYNIDNLL